MAIDKRQKRLKRLRMVQYDAFERVCEQLGITYTFPPEYYRRATRRWKAKKAFCIQVDFPSVSTNSCCLAFRRTGSICRTSIYRQASSGHVTLRLHRRLFILCVSSQVHKEVQKQKAAQRKQMKQSLAATNTYWTSKTQFKTKLICIIVKLVMILKFLIL